MSPIPHAGVACVKSGIMPSRTCTLIPAVSLYQCTCTILLCNSTLKMLNNHLQASFEIYSLPKYTRVDCGLSRIYSGVDPELYARGRLQRLSGSTLFCDRMRCFRLLESIPAYLNIPPFSRTMQPSYNLPLLPRLYHPFLQLYAILPESTPPRTSTHLF